MSTTAPILRALTEEARKAIQRDERMIEHVPYRVGRERRVALIGGEYRSIERRETSALPTNELYLLDMGDKLNVSREHFQIEQEQGGSYVLTDRGSACGTIVDDQPVGGQDHGGRFPLRNGSTIRVGTSSSPYLFEFVIPESG
ncbi:MAG: FHA domain-containing protein [Kiritimatiellia bacterium]|jgi:pSer/pThr/pTyr-binding forkhead associated (FHA) protein|nr:FHA domain-containing protein [Kiritimatiellia bacterium]MDP6630552.1 FHA domain-containing protein [Kiritimatiellia bacterium]MDP6811226.1 FHA domain-containing protein [Kiritimatiellia bacterium]MDP7024329.1 FHA domain-containing protein [Kiritimatiellia bacterium]